MLRNLITELINYMSYYKIAEIFTHGIGKLKNFSCHLEMKSDFNPIFFKPGPALFALKERVEAELNRIVSEDIIEPVKHSEWMILIAPALKVNIKLRIYGDYKVTINLGLNIEHYPLPKIEDIFTD